MSAAPIAPAPVPAAPSKVKKILKKALDGFLTAVTSSAAVKGEKNLAITIVTGVAIAVGASDGLVQIITKIIQGL